MADGGHEFQLPGPNFPHDYVTGFAVDTEGKLWVVREFTDGTTVTEQPSLNDFADGFRRAQAVGRMDPDNNVEVRAEETDEPRRAPNLYHIRRQIRDEKLARGQYVPPEYETYIDDEGNIRCREVMYLDNGEVSFREVEDLE